MIKMLSTLICLSLAAALFCGTAGAEENSLFTTRDLTQEADLTGAERITLDGSSVTIDHDGVFLLSGILQDGQILVEAGDADKVQLVLDGVSIHKETGAAIEIRTADKVFITLAPGSENLLSAGSVTEDGVDGVIFSKADLTLNGTGALSVTAQAGHGIVCKDTLAITGGIYTIQAAGHGITGKDALNIADGSFTITTGGGSTAVEMEASDAFGQRGGFWGSTASQDEEEAVKAKGLKSDGAVTVLSGSFTLDCADDAVHAGGDVSISDGDWTIRSADDGIHADGDVLIGGGKIALPYCYEGIEGKNVTIDSGSISITSNDDGINATGEETGNQFGPGMDTGAVITINSGETTVVSGGDCIDSNGTIVLNGGKLNLTCNGSGNTALDSESGITNNGADVTTNDGSENGGGFGMGRGKMGGGRGQFGGEFPQDGQFPGKGSGRPEGDFQGDGKQPDGTSQATPPSSDTASTQNVG